MAVEFTSEGGIGFLTLDNPPANSYDAAVMAEFSAAVDEAIAGDARVVILRSASEKFFCAGADIKRFLEGDVAANMQMIRTSHAAFARMAGAEQVFIAHLAGHALGGGLELALACDLRLATAGSYKLGTPEVTLGLLPGNGGTQRLTRLVGPGRGLELLITGRTFSVEEASQWGIVNAVYAPEEAEQRVREFAERLAVGPRLAIASIKRCVHEGMQRSLEDGLRLERELIEQLFRSRDADEGLHAFVEKRNPTFVGA
jgi:enoyl-CoA hydratase/carnithine racemase